MVCISICPKLSSILFPFDQSSPVQPVPESRGGSTSVMNERRRRRKSLCLILDIIKWKKLSTSADPPPPHPYLQNVDKKNVLFNPSLTLAEACQMAEAESINLQKNL